MVMGASLLLPWEQPELPQASCATRIQPDFSAAVGTGGILLPGLCLCSPPLPALSPRLSTGCWGAELEVAADLFGGAVSDGSRQLRSRAVSPDPSLPLPSFHSLFLFCRSSLRFVFPAL